MKSLRAALTILLPYVAFSGESSLRIDVYEGRVNDAEHVTYRKTTTRRGENVIKVFEEEDLTRDGSWYTKTEKLMDAGETVVTFTHGPKGKLSCIIKPGAKAGILKIDDDGDCLYDRLYLTNATDNLVEGFRRNEKGFWDPMSDDEIADMKDLLKRTKDFMKDFD